MNCPETFLASCTCTHMPYIRVLWRVCAYFSPPNTYPPPLPPPASTTFFFYICNERPAHAGVENFVFVKGRTLISSQTDVTFPYGCDEDGRTIATFPPDEDSELLIKNLKEKGPMFKMREPRKYIYIYI